jgi:hypothetical protein
MKLSRERILILCLLSLSLFFFASQIHTATAADYCSTLLSTYTVADWYNAATEEAGSTITYTFSQIIDPNTGDGVRCTWKSTSGFGQTARTGTFSVTGPGNLTAIYQTQYQLAYSVSPTSGGSIDLNPTDPGDGWYDSGTIVSLTANPASGYAFLSWSDGGAQSHSITMNQATMLTANFARAVDHFTFETIPSPQTAGSSFTVTIAAVDADGNTVTSYNGPNMLNDTTGTISPSSTGVFLNGIWSGSVIITKVQSEVTITTSGNGKTGNSNSFDVVSMLDHFVFDTISSPQVAGTAFAITITAVDAYGNTVTSYIGPNVLSDSTETITPTITTSFISGVWTGSVTITHNQTGVSIITSGAGKVGESNLFDVVGTASETSSFDFTVTASPINEQVGRGGPLSVSVAVLLLRGTGEEIVNLTVSGAPPTMQTSFDVQSGTPTFTSTLTITPDTSTPLGAYALIIHGTTSGGLTRSAMLNIEVARQTPNDFTIRIDPSGAVTVPDNSIATVTVTVFRGGYTEPVTLSYPDLPTGISVDCTPDSGASSFQASCSITVDASVFPSAYVIEIRGTGGGGEQKSGFFLLIVESSLAGDPPSNPDYLMTVNPTSLTAMIPATETWDTQMTITVRSLAGFNQQVSFSSSGLPTGITAAFTPNSVTPQPNGQETSILKLTIGSSAMAGTYKLRVTGISLSLTRTSDFLLTLGNNPQTSGLYVEILAPENAATVSDIFSLTANCTDLTYGPGNVEGTYRVSSSTWTSQWFSMIPPHGGDATWTAAIDSIGMQLANGDYILTVKATRLNDPAAESTDTIIVHVDNSGALHISTFLINYPQAALLQEEGDTYNPAWWYEEDHFLPGETMGVRISTGEWAGRSDVRIAISINSTLVYPSLLSQYPATQTSTGAVPTYVTAVFPFDFSKPGIYGQWQVIVEVIDVSTGNPIQTIQLGNAGAFIIEGADADWYTLQHLDHASVVVTLKWPDTGDSILHRTGTISASGMISTTSASGAINDAGGIVIWTPYMDWHGQPVFAVTYTGSNVDVMRDTTTPLEQTFTYDVLAVTYVVTGQDYSETVNLEFFARYQTGHPAVDTYVALQVSTGQPWLKTETSGGRAAMAVAVANPDGSKPLTWTIRAWTYAVKVTSQTIYANQWANLEVDHEDYTTTVVVDGIGRQTGGLNVNVSVASGAMWLDMGNVNATITIKNQAGQVVGQEAYMVTIFHGQVNDYTWLVNGEYTPGTYTVEVTLIYCTLSPPATIGNTTRQLAAN